MVQQQINTTPAPKLAPRPPPLPAGDVLSWYWVADITMRAYPEERRRKTMRPYIKWPSMSPSSPALGLGGSGTVSRETSQFNLTRMSNRAVFRGENGCESRRRSEVEGRNRLEVRRGSYRCLQLDRCCATNTAFAACRADSRRGPATHQQ